RLPRPPRPTLFPYTTLFRSQADAVRRLFEDAQPRTVIHLAAEVGGIGANRANPGRYWYANLMMGAHLIEQARSSGLEKLVLAGTDRKSTRLNSSHLGISYAV